MSDDNGGNSQQEQGTDSKAGNEPEAEKSSQKVKGRHLSTQPGGQHPSAETTTTADVLDLPDLPRPSRRRPRRSKGRSLLTSFLADDAIPTSCDEDGEPLYARTELDKRCEALLACYDQGEPNPDAVLISDAFFAIIAPENLAHADEAVAVLELLVRRAKHRTHYLLSKQLEALEASGLPHPTDDGPRRRA